MRDRRNETQSASRHKHPPNETCRHSLLLTALVLGGLEGLSRTHRDCCVAAKACCRRRRDGRSDDNDDEVRRQQRASELLRQTSVF